MKKIVVVLIVSIVCIVTGCKQSNNDDILHTAIEDIKPALKQMDRRMAIYEGMLNSINTYIVSPTDANLKASKLACAQAIADIANLPSAQSTLSKEDKQKLIEIGLNLADYNVPFENEAYNKQDCIQNITAILRYLDQAPYQNDALTSLHGLLEKNNRVFKKVDYLCLNALFCEFSGSEIAIFKDEFLPQLSSFSADALPWETLSEVLEAKANTLMDEAEEDISAYADFVGQQYNTLLKEQYDYKTMLLEEGFSSDDAENIIENIEALSIS